MYHGTSWERACEIESGGFQISDGGRLGAGVYVARYEKARQFALAFDRHKGETGGMLEVVISFLYPKYVSFEDDEWQSQGYDACRADETAKSTAARLKCPSGEPLPPEWRRRATEALWRPPKVTDSTACRYQHGVVCQVRGPGPGGSELGDRPGRL